MITSHHRPHDRPTKPAAAPNGFSVSLRNLALAAGRGRSLLVLLALTFAGGCQSVQPWERGTFADYTMRPDRDPLHTAMSEHIHFSREASSGGRGVGGSGCGCN